MHKDNSGFNDFLSLFKSLNKNNKQFLRYYFMIGHPGDDQDEVLLLKKRLYSLKNIEQFQVFTPTPMTISTCMYWTGLNPFTMESVDVVRDYKTKKKLKRMLLGDIKYRALRAGGKTP